ncbi:CbrC family protein [Streptomyces sp. NPDC048416]|uniref:CbrC family protein n=1 Tax=Streptomyces sp. NPDC048416 TaxID=3365546 RepID=UPI00370FC2F3
MARPVTDGDDLGSPEASRRGNSSSAVRAGGSCRPLRNCRTRGSPRAVGDAPSGGGGWGQSAAQVQHVLNSLAAESESSAYLFRCRRCAAHLAYTDFAN